MIAPRRFSVTLVPGPLFLPVVLTARLFSGPSTTVAITVRYPQRSQPAESLGPTKQI